MTPSRWRCRGFSLIELLVVLAIVGILTGVGIVMLGNRPSGAVRGLMDELEGTISGAQKLATARGQDVLLATQGDWGGGVGITPMLMAYGTEPLPSTILDATHGQIASESFRVAVNASGALQREHMHAGVVTLATAGWWDTAKGASVDITANPPFKGATAVFKDTLTSNPNIFNGGTTPGVVRISGANKRFTTTFWIQIVSLRNGQPIPGGPMGLLIVQANGAQIFKFYNPGIISGDNGAWRRI